MVNTDNVYQMLITDLGKLNPPQATVEYLKNLISAAIAEIGRMGITLKTETAEGSEEENYTVDDAQTVEMYAAYLYRKRADSDNGMPRMLDWRLKCRLFSEKGATDV